MAPLRAALLAAAALLLPAPVWPSVTEPLWTYENQAIWYQVAPQCRSFIRVQSPVALTPSTDQQLQEGEKPQLLFASGIKTGTLTATNTGRTLSVTMQGGDPTEPAARIQGTTSTPLNGAYTLHHMELHWNDPNGGRGSEHQLNGAFEQAEAQFLFYNEQYADYEAAKLQSDGLAGVAVLLRPETMQMPGFPTLNLTADMMTLAPLGGTVTRPQDLRDLRPLLQTAMQNFYSYKGSLTSPPCSLVVQWMVAAQPMEVDLAFLQQLRTTLQKNIAGDILENNFRLLQSLGTRTITRYFTL